MKRKVLSTFVNLELSNTTLFKTELMTALDKTYEFAKINYNKTNELYKLIIASSDTTISNYKSDLSNSKNIAKEFRDNIKNIKERYENKEKLNKEIKEKLSAKKEPEVAKIVENEEVSLFDNLTSLFQGF